MKTLIRQLFAFSIFLLAIPLTANGQDTGETPTLTGEMFPQTHQRSLTESEVAEWTEAKIRYAINEMFARHGAAFDKPDLKNAFTRFPWYKPRKELTLDQIEQDFSDLEKENLKLLAYFRDAKAQGSRSGKTPKARQRTVPSPPQTTRNNPAVPKFFQSIGRSLQTALQQSLPAQAQSSPARSTVTQTSAAVTPTQTEAAPGISDTQIAPSAERFVIKGLRVGDGPAKVNSFLSENNLRLERPAQTGSVQGNKAIQRISYVQFGHYTNGREGLQELTVTLGFTPPFPGPEGVASRISSIGYWTHYGEGVSVASIIQDLEQKYGKPTNLSQQRGPEGYTTMSWEVKGGAYTATAFIMPSEEAGKPGEFRIEVSDHYYAAEAERRAKNYVDQVDLARPKDTRKPDF